VNRQTLGRSTPALGTRPGAPFAAPSRMTVRRVRLRSLARVGFGLGWLLSLLPAILVSALGVWVLHGIWGTLNGWTPWTPWPPGQRVAGFTLPTPEFRPREALRVEDLYHWLTPVGQHPLLAVVIGAAVLTLVGGIVVALALLLAGAGYNVFARATGGIEFELAPRPEYPAPPAGHRSGARDDADRRDWRDDAELEW
jgi:hypothetical protein